MFHADVPAEEKTVDRLTEEGILFVVAGNETTGNALSVMTFHILNNPIVLQNLRKELVGVMPDPKFMASWQELERLPYLVSNCHPSKSRYVNLADPVGGH